MRPPIVVITLAFGVGLWVGIAPARDAPWGMGDAFAVLPVLVTALLVRRRAPVGAALGIAGVAGLVWGAAAVAVRAGTCAGQWARGTGEGGRGARATVVRLFDPVPATGGVVDARVVGGRCGGALRLRWPAGLRARGGTAWLVAGRWVGSADRGVLVVRRARQLDAEPRGRGAVRHRIAERAAALFGERAPLVDALVIARRAELATDVRERYVRSGLAHLLSISGLHVGFIAAWLAVALRRCQLPAVSRFVASTTLVVAYVWLLGWPAPAARASLMLAVDGVARLRQRVVAPRGSIALATLVVLLVDPWAVRSVGAWLSVTAVSGVIWAARAGEHLPGVVRLILPAAAATLLTAPITAFVFGTVAPIGVLANLVAIPLGALAVPGLIVALALSWVLPGLASLLASGAGIALALLDLVAGAAAKIPWGHVISAPGWQPAAIWIVIAAVAWWLWHSPRRAWLIGARVSFVLTVASWTSLFDAVSLDDPCCLTVHFLDVGQGDATVVRTPGGRWVVIDGGPRSADRDAGRAVVVPFLRRRGVERLDLVVATHGHADHYGGLPAVLETFETSVVIEPGEAVGEPLYLEFLAAVQASGATWHQARAGDRFELDGVALEVLSPDSAWMAWASDVNEHSVVLLVRFGRARLVLAGDAGEPVEVRLAGRVGDVDALKVGHHGSATATSPAWLAELRPEYAVISVGARNRYGHPAAEVLERLAGHGIEVLRTDQAGTVTLVVDSARAHTDVRHHD